MSLVAFLIVGSFAAGDGAQCVGFGPLHFLWGCLLRGMKAGLRGDRVSGINAGAVALSFHVAVFFSLSLLPNLATSSFFQTFR